MTKKLFTKKELQEFGELCRDTREKEILEIIDEIWVQWCEDTTDSPYKIIEELKQKIKGEK